jgi:hypothetical protein
MILTAFLRLSGIILLPFSFQVSGSGRFGLAKTRFGGRRKNRKGAVDHIQISDTLHVSICFF